MSGGVWARAGMGGELAGLDWSAVFARLNAQAPACDRDDVVVCLEAIERGALDGVAARIEGGGGV